MLAWFHDLCVDNGLRYYALGGTMLGAARHQGFIPWDDDIDVGMPRSDYENLISLIGNRKYKHYYLETPLSKNTDYRYPFSKLYNTNTTLIENTWPKLVRGIFIDIFPLDGLGNSMEESKNNWEEIIRIANFMWARLCAVRLNRSWYKNVAIIAAHCIPSIIAGDKIILKKMDDLCKRKSFDEVSYGGNVFGNWGLKEIMPIMIMGEPQLFKFEDIQIHGASDYDRYLTFLYDKWRILPPKEKQVSHHDFIKIDLKRGFMY